MLTFPTQHNQCDSSEDSCRSQHDHIDFCGDDIVPNTSFSQVVTWKSMAFSTTSANTGARRSMGPTAPQHLFPNNPGTQMFTMLDGSYFLGSILATVGYNWDDMQDTRFGIVKVPSMRDSKAGFPGLLLFFLGSIVQGHLGKRTWV
ncbi:hypothetical protein M3I54_33200 [Paraburkholderia sp. CNPSo 3274]|uniref:hypothetical protein n=1 Tax=Paraburkholderia sp. CNPSo 3274 TaxID=2940932 RepID=UPI0020B7FC32|nr:hypothetical protein [Paraburkholderia sp. CNPSo 3274]MCP3711755.1 hypothetical protein [Paraburkholderia sp. CNPSo 3274]